MPRALNLLAALASGFALIVSLHALDRAGGIASIFLAAFCCLAFTLGVLTFFFLGIIRK